MFDLESDVGHFEVACWGCFLMEGVSARRQVDILRLISLGCPAFYCLAFSFIALVDLDLSTGDFCTSKVDLTESYLTWKIIILIGHCNS